MCYAHDPCTGKIVFGVLEENWKRKSEGNEHHREVGTPEKKF
jgi:hypothetical protein